ncbi:MAG: DnaJ domain-containing protein [Deltaproteobacteria bacterium]
MAIWDRFTDRLREAIDAPGGPRRPGGGEGIVAPVGLAERLGLTRISDDALGTELERRRRARGRTANRRTAADEELDAMREARRARLRERPLSRAYAALEIKPSATRGEIERAYRSMLRQFHPDRHVGDPEQHQSAIALATSLTDSYLALLQRYEPR